MPVHQNDLAVSQPLSMRRSDIEFLRKRAQETGLSMSGVVRLLVRRERVACGDLQDVDDLQEPNSL